jgi:hypothetical protein
MALKEGQGHKHHQSVHLTNSNFDILADRKGKFDWAKPTLTLHFVNTIPTFLHAFAAPLLPPAVMHLMLPFN